MKSKKNHENKQTFIISPSMNICNKMFAHGMYPEILKFSLMKPIYKSGDKSSPNNYRPIACIFKNFWNSHIPKIIWSSEGKCFIEGVSIWFLKQGVNGDSSLYIAKRDTAGVQHETDGGRNILWPP